MMHPVWKHVVFGLAGLVLVAAGAAGAGQQKPSEPAPGWSEGGAVAEKDTGPRRLLDAIVTGPDGKPVLGLDKDDFVVKVGGQPVPIDDVTFCSVRRRMHNTGLVTDKIKEDRYFILVFQRENEITGRSIELMELRKQVNQLVKKWLTLLEPNDWVAVAVYTRKLEVLQDFTRDPDALVSALDRTVVATPEGAKPGPAGAVSLLAGLPQGRELVTRTTTIDHALEEIATATRGIGARKNLLLLSDSKEGQGRAGTPRAAGPEYNQTLDALNRANVAVYTMDVLRRMVVPQKLLALAAETGGFQGDIGPTFEKVLYDSAAYYLIQYRPPQPQGIAKSLDIEVATTRPGLQIRTRRTTGAGD